MSERNPYLKTCDGTDPELIQYVDGEGVPTADPELAAAVGPCECGSQFDERYHELPWPHLYKQLAAPTRVVNDLPDMFGRF